MPNLTIDRFERAVQRFEQAEASLISIWKAPCHCSDPGERPECWQCPAYKGLGRLIQGKLDACPAQALAEILPIEYEDPYCEEVRRQCCDLYQNNYPIQEIQRLTGISSRRVLRSWLREVGLPGRSAHYPEAIKQQCLQMYADRIPVRQIEEATDIPADTITDWAMQAKITRKTKYPPETKQQCLDLYQSGLSSEDIQAMIGISAITVRNWIAEADISRGQHRYSQEDRQKCQRLYQQGQTIQQIAALTGIKVVTLRSWKRKERWDTATNLDEHPTPESTQVQSATRKPPNYWKSFDHLKIELLRFNEARGKIGCMPTAEELRQSDRGDIQKSISKYHGGFQTVAERLGLTYRKRGTGYWQNFEHLKTELFAFIREHGIPGTMPTKTELETAHKTALCFAIAQHGGFPVVAKHLKLKLSYDRKPRGYWKNLDNLKMAIDEVNQALGISGTLPNHEDLKQLGRTDLINAISNNGGWPSVAKKLGLEYVKPLHPNPFGIKRNPN